MSNELAKTQETGSGLMREGTRGGPFYRPSVDIVETQDELLLKAEMPGTAAEDVSLDYDKGLLTLHGKVKARQPENMKYIFQEYGVGDFHREFTVTNEIDSSRISAEYTDGVLTVHLPKAEAAKPKRIAVKTS